MPTVYPEEYGSGAILRLGADQSVIHAKRRIAPPPTAELWADAPAPADNDKSRYFEIFDDFLYPASATASDVMAWTSMDDAGTGTNAFQGVPGGVYNIVTAAADNDYHGIRSVAKNFLFAAGKKAWMEARFKVAEATTDDSTWAFGFTDTVTTGGIGTDTNGPLSSYDGAVIWKTPEAGMTVNFETSNAGTQSTISEFATSITDTWHRVGMYFDGASPVSLITPYFHNGSGWTVGQAAPITLAGLEAMYLFATIKAGPGGAAETLQLDYIRAVQLR